MHVPNPISISSFVGAPRTLATGGSAQTPGRGGREEGEGKGRGGKGEFCVIAVGGYAPDYADREEGRTRSHRRLFSAANFQSSITFQTKKA